jgi:cell division protein FtsW
MVIVIAHYLTELGDNVKRFRAGILIPMLYTGFLALLIAKSPDFGAVIVLLMTFFCILFTSGVRVGYLLAIFVPAISGLMFAAVKLEYIRNRIIGFLHPDKDPLGKGYQILQSLMALGSGGLFGVGVGRSRAKFNYLPEAHTDYIFSIVGEELGLIGTVFVVTMLFFIIWRGFKAAIGAKDVFGTLLGAGIVCMIGTQAILNIGVVTSSLPVTGVTLPLLSYGGSSLIVTLTGLGILLNISRQAK